MRYTDEQREQMELERSLTQEHSAAVDQMDHIIAKLEHETPNIRNAEKFRVAFYMPSTQNIDGQSRVFCVDSRMKNSMPWLVREYINGLIRLNYELIERAKEQRFSSWLKLKAALAGANK